MGRINICDLCKKKLPRGLSDTDYKVIVKKRWWSYDGFTPYRERTKLEICSVCMKKFIKEVRPTLTKGNKERS